eukprot:5266518-Amphidinium_carterae.1
MVWNMTTIGPQSGNVAPQVEQGRRGLHSLQWSDNHYARWYTSRQFRCASQESGDNLTHVNLDDSRKRQSVAIYTTWSTLCTLTSLTVTMS